MLETLTTAKNTLTRDLYHGAVAAGALIFVAFFAISFKKIKNLQHVFPTRL